VRCEYLRISKLVLCHWLWLKLRHEGAGEAARYSLLLRLDYGLVGDKLVLDHSLVGENVYARTPIRVLGRHHKIA
jgi:hypothetical protein